MWKGCETWGFPFQRWRIFFCAPREKIHWMMNWCKKLKYHLMINWKGWSHCMTSGFISIFLNHVLYFNHMLSFSIKGFKAFILDTTLHKVLHIWNKGIKGRLGFLLNSAIQYLEKQMFVPWMKHQHKEGQSSPILKHWFVQFQLGIYICLLMSL